MNRERIDAIERVLDKRASRKASDASLIDWLESLKDTCIDDQHGIITLDGFIDAIRQTPLNY